MKKKDIWKLLIIISIVILLLILVYFLIKIINYNKSVKIVDGIHTQEDIDIIEEEVKDYLSDKIAPKGLSKLYGKYDGENDFNDMYRNIYSFVNYLPKISKKIKYDNNESISSYYEENKNDIKNIIGITKLSDFEEFIEYLNKTNYNGEKFLECQIDNETFKNEKDYFSFDLIFTFDNFDNEFKLKLSFANKTITKPMVYYSVVKDKISE